MLVDENIRSNKAWVAINFPALPRTVLAYPQYILRIANHSGAHDGGARTRSCDHATSIEDFPNRLQHRRRLAIGKQQRLGYALLCAARKEDAGAGLDFGDQRGLERAANVDAAICIFTMDRKTRGEV